MACLPFNPRVPTFPIVASIWQFDGVDEWEEVGAVSIQLVAPDKSAHAVLLDTSARRRTWTAPQTQRAPTTMFAYAETFDLLRDPSRVPGEGHIGRDFLTVSTEFLPETHHYWIDAVEPRFLGHSNQHVLVVLARKHPDEHLADEPSDPEEELHKSCGDAYVPASLPDQVQFSIPRQESFWIKLPADDQVKLTINHTATGWDLSSISWIGPCPEFVDWDTQQSSPANTPTEHANVGCGRYFEIQPSEGTGTVTVDIESTGDCGD